MKLLNYDEVADMLQTPKTTLYSWVKQRKIPHIRISERVVRFDREAIVEWLSSQNSDNQ